MNNNIVNEINKNEYSLFKNINDIVNLKEKKYFKSLIEDFINTLVQLNDIYIKSECNIEINEYVNNFLIELGIFNSNYNSSDLETLKKILGNQFEKFYYVINEYLRLDKQNEYLINRFMDKYRKKQVENYLNDTDSFTIIDLFCGAGGMSLGFYNNGYKIILANDIEQACIDTYYFNHCEMPKSRVITDDIKNVVDNIDKLIKEKVDVIIGGPPCQGFSTANRQRIIDDPRNVLYKEYVQFVEKVKPCFFIMENVKGMLSVADQVVDDFHNLKNVDYKVDYKVFNAKDFGVPQNRERLIYIGMRKDIIEYLNKEPINIIEEIIEKCNKVENFSLAEAINDLRPLEPLKIMNSTELDTDECGRKIEKNTSKLTKYTSLINNEVKVPLIFNHKARFNNERDIKIFGLMLQGDKSDSERIANIMPYKNRNNIFKDKYYKLKENTVCKTITAHMKFDCNMYIHPNQARGLTPREAARVQSYPDYYFFRGPFTKTYMQIGNSVPPLMSKIFAEVIKQQLEAIKDK